MHHRLTCWIHDAASFFQIVLTALVLTCLSASQFLVAENYTITDLGTLGGPDSRAAGINNFGQVVGTSLNGQTYQLQFCRNHCGGLHCPGGGLHCQTHTYGAQHSFLWTPAAPNGTYGSLTDLGTLGGPGSIGQFINNLGQVIGNAQLGTTFRQDDGGDDCCGSSWHYYYRSDEFLWSPSRSNASTGSIADLMALGFPINAWPASINAAGQIVGNLSVSNAFLWQDGTLTNLGSLGGGETYPTKINDQIQVVGVSVTSEGPRAFLWQDGAMRNLGTLLGDLESGAGDLNTNGQVVGYSASTNNTRAFLFTLGSSAAVTSRRDLGTLPGSSSSIAYAINNRGEVLGASSAYTNSGPNHAFLWDSANGMRDLISLIPPGSGWTYNYSDNERPAINDAGQIVGTGVNPAGQTRAFLLTPLPAPSLSVVAMLDNGGFRFTLSGAAGRSYAIQASSNLVNWTAVTNFVSATGTNKFTDTTAPNFTRRFYRAATQ